jgi:hypothetical protein
MVVGNALQRIVTEADDKFFAENPVVEDKKEE